MPHDRFHVVINARSGTALAMGEDSIRKMIDESGLGLESVHILSPDELHERTEELLETPYPVLIGGGDGTIARSAALHLAKGKPFGILPFGTMNMLAQDLGIPVDFAQSLKAHVKTKVISIDIGMVNNQSFLCCAALGTMPEAAEFREANRGIPNIVLLPRLTAFVFNQLDQRRERPMTIELDGRLMKTRTSMLVISNNRYDPSTPEEPFKKETLDEGILGVYTVTPNTFWDKVRLGFVMTKGGWKSDPAISEYRARRVTVKKTGRRKELVSLDGEPMEMTVPLEFKVVHKGLKIIVPVPENPEQEDKPS